jgi:DnaJ homolog subfamily A member 5
VKFVVSLSERTRRREIRQREHSTISCVYVNTTRISKKPTTDVVCVQKFVEFIRKKDPRLTAFLKADRLRRKQQEEERAAQRAEQKKLQAQDREIYERESAAIMDSIHFDEDDHERLGIKTKPKRPARQNQEGEPEPDEFDSDDEDVEQQHYCVACHKKFKSIKQYENHEKSKKHKENVIILKAEVMLDDEIEQYLQDQKELDEQLHQMETEENTELAAPESQPTPDADTDDMNDPAMMELLEQLKVSKVSTSEVEQQPADEPKVETTQPVKETVVSEDEDDEADDGGEDFFLQAMMAKAQTKNKKQQKKAKKASARNAFSVLMDDVADYETHLESQKPVVTEDSEESSEEEPPRPSATSSSSASSSSTTATAAEAKTSSPLATPESGKKQQQKKRRRKAKGDTAQSSAAPSEAPAAAPAAAPKSHEFQCRVCNQPFGTRNELFQHLKDSKHASTK